MDEKFSKVLSLFKERMKKDCYKMVCQDGEPGVMDNKIGGTPFFPVGEEFPLDKDGNPMALLLQVNLAEIELENFSGKGILEVFVDREAGYPCQYQVKYFDESLEHNPNIPSVPLDDFITEKPIKISFEKDVCHMCYSDYRFNDSMIAIVNEVYGVNISTVRELDDTLEYLGDWYEDFFKELSIPGGNIGGYPDFTQNDPRNVRSNDMTECVFKIDSMLSKEIMIGDSGIFFGLISKEDLQNCNFDKMLVDWDCC